MLLSRNPTDQQIKNIISRSSESAAKWLKDSKTGAAFYWEAEAATHAKMAKLLHIEEYEKGIAIYETLQ